MSTFAPAALPQLAQYDPTKHVNYALGMVLGVDDFNQEFTFLSASDRRAIRTLLGYGVVDGLHVTVTPTGQSGPQVQVAPGTAVTAAGHLLCVTPTQCANLNDWLAGNAAAVEALGSPPGGMLPLSLVACYTECPTDDVPIPGEPCRSADELMAASRLQASFTLDLRLSTPDQVEEIAIRDFVAWLEQIPVMNIPDPGVETVLDIARAQLATVGSPPSSPPGSESAALLDFLLVSPPPGMTIPSAQKSEYFRALLRFWVEELRPRLHGPGDDCGCGCSGAPPSADEDCVLVAELAVPVERDAITGALLVADTPEVLVDETTRPTLLSMRMLQELLLVDTPGGAGSGLTGPAGPQGPAGAEGPAGPQGPPGESPKLPLVAAGIVDPTANPPTVSGASGGLAAQSLADDLILLSYTGFDSTQAQIVFGQPIWSTSKFPLQLPPNTPTPQFAVYDPADPGIVALLPSSPPTTGVVVRAGVPNGPGAFQPTPFIVRIEQQP